MSDIQRNIVLAPFTTFHIGGPADYFITARNEQELIDAIIHAKSNKIPFFVLGMGANILVGDKGFRGMVIKNEAKSIELLDTLLTAESGAVVADIIALTYQKGFSGFEHFAGIPSTIGGALWQNLHFLSPDRSKTMYISEILESAKIYTLSNEIITVDKNYFKFDYDWSVLHEKQDVVLSATFRLNPEKIETINSIIKANLAWRAQKHPKSAPTCSAGSVFKKLERYGAGRLIEKVGLKGKQIGGARISETHANFIVNTGKASAKDVRSLIDLVQLTVKRELNLNLEPEISFIGEF